VRRRWIVYGVAAERKLDGELTAACRTNGRGGPIVADISDTAALRFTSAPNSFVMKNLVNTSRALTS